MKKTMTLFVLLCTLCLTSHATLIFHESFDRTVGTLNKGTSQDYMGTNTADWWSFSGTNNYISVVENSLSYEGYATAVGKKVELLGVGADDLRQFSPITSGKVYAAAIINVDSLKQGTGADYFFTLGDAGAMNMYARLLIKSVKESDTYVGYQLGITKTNEISSAYGWTGQTLQPKKNYLIVLEYEFVNGEMNDTTRLYINPTKNTTKADAECVQEWLNYNNQNKGAGGFADATKISSVNLRKGTSTPGRVYVDEIKVATAWSDLFESGDSSEQEEKATIKTTKTKLDFGGLYVDNTLTRTFTVSGKNLSGDITLKSDNEELVLGPTTITKAAAEAAGGVEVTATLTAATAGEKTAKITLTSNGADTVTIAVSWTAVAITKVATIAELKDSVATDEEGTTPFLFTGEAVVTYSEAGSYQTIYYVEDATGAVRIDEWFGDFTLNVGDKIKDAIVYKGEEAGLSGQPLSFNAKPTIVSSGNTPTPQVVTLKALKDNAADYLLELVKVEDVAFDLTKEANYTAGNNAIAQDGTSAVISLTTDNTLVGTAKPATADITGISYFTTGYNIRVRSAADIVVKTLPTAIETITLDQLTGEYEVYTLSGQRTDALHSGVNIIRQGNAIYKVVR